MSRRSLSIHQPSLLFRLDILAAMMKCHGGETNAVAMIRVLSSPVPWLALMKVLIGG